MPITMDDYVNHTVGFAYDLATQEDDDDGLLDVLIFNAAVDPALDEFLDNTELDAFIKDVTDEQGEEEINRNLERVERRDARIRVRLQRKKEKAEDRLEGERLDRKMERLYRRAERWERRKANGGTKVGKIQFRIKCIACNFISDKKGDKTVDELIKELLKVLLKIGSWIKGPLIAFIVFIASKAINEALECETCGG